MWVFIILAILILTVLIIVGISMVCVHIIVKAQKTPEEKLRKQEIEHGFADALKDYDNKWKRIPFVADTGEIKLSGEYIINETDHLTPKKVVVICHGHIVSRICSLKYAKVYYNKGFNIVLYDERYFGKSEGDYCTLGQKESKDLQTITALARKTFGEDCILALHGESMGAATVLASLDYESPDFVVADCPFASSIRLYEHVLKDNMHLPIKPILPIACMIAEKKYGYTIKEFNPIEAVRNSDVPICFMHGLDDKLIPCEHSEAMFKVCRNQKSEIHLFKGADHAMSMSSDKERYEKELVGFIEKVL